MNKAQANQNSSGIRKVIRTNAVFGGVALAAVNLIGAIALFLLTSRSGAATGIFIGIIVITAVLLTVVILLALRRGEKTATEHEERLSAVTAAAQQLAGGDWNLALTPQEKSETEQLSFALSQLADVLRQSTQAAQSLAQGDFSVPDGTADGQNTLFQAIGDARGSIAALANEQLSMLKAHNAGDIDVRIPEQKFTGTFAQMAHTVNQLVDSHITVKKKAMAVVAEFAKGNFDTPLEQFPGKKAFINDNIEQLRGNIQSFIHEMNEMSRQHDLGDIDVRMPEQRFEGAFAQMAQGVNRMVEGHITVKKKAMAVVAEFAKGNFDAPLEKFPGKKAFINDNIERLRGNIQSFIHEMNEMSRQHDLGDIDVRMPEQQFEGAFAQMAQGVNRMVEGHITVKKKAMAVVAEFAKGNFDAPLEKFPGKKAFINDNIEQLRTDLKRVNSEISRLIRSARAGQLDARGNVQEFQGGWRTLIGGLNDLLAAMTLPIQEAGDVLGKMALGDLTVAVRGDYHGDHAKIKEAVNTLAGSFNDMLGEIQRSAQQVSAGSQQVSDSAQLLSQGAVEQTSSVEELTAFVNKLTEQTRQNAENATRVSKLADTAMNDAQSGNEKMKKMLIAIHEIKESSASISKVIKVIDDIAFQTNILALNAAVEAARAGQYGKGFAVVAEEVRNLAAKSAEAANETTALIEGSFTKVETGTKIADETAEVLREIAGSVDRTGALIGNIAQASSEQATAIAQIDTGITQVSSVVQQNSATAEESAASSEELSGQAESLMQLARKFSLKA